jgi:hypothetical protein
VLLFLLRLHERASLHFFSALQAEISRGFDMAKKVLNQAPVVREIAGVEIKFVFVPTIGRAPLDELDTDLALITKVHAMDLPAAVRIGDSDVLRHITDTIRSEFPGRRGTYKVLNVPLKNSRRENGRHLLFFGLGPCQTYNGNIVCDTFRTLFTQALELRSESVTVPFIPNPMTKDCLSHKSTALWLKDVLRQVLEKHEGPVSLREVKLWCSPAAVRHIRKALEGTDGEGCYCEVFDEDEE